MSVCDDVLAFCSTVKQMISGDEKMDEQEGGEEDDANFDGWYLYITRLIDNKLEKTRLHLKR